MIDRFGPLALFSPVVIAAIVSCLMSAQYAPTKNAAEDGARAADVLLDALRADLSRRLVRSSDRLDATRRTFERLLTHARALKELLQSDRPPRVVLAKAKDWFGARIDYCELRRWERKTPTAIAMEVLAGRLGIGQKANATRRADIQTWLPEANRHYAESGRGRPAVVAAVIAPSASAPVAPEITDPATESAPSPAVGASLEAQLHSLDALLSRGTVTETEHGLLRKRLIETWSFQNEAPPARRGRCRGLIGRGFSGAGRGATKGRRSVWTERPSCSPWSEGRSTG